MSTAHFPGSNIFDSQIKMHTGTGNNDLSLAKEFKDYLEEEHRQNSVIYEVKYKNDSRK